MLSLKTFMHTGTISRAGYITVGIFILCLFSVIFHSSPVNAQLLKQLPLPSVTVNVPLGNALGLGRVTQPVNKLVNDGLGVPVTLQTQPEKISVEANLAPIIPVHAQVNIPTPRVLERTTRQLTPTDSRILPTTSRATLTPASERAGPIPQIGSIQRNSDGQREKPTQTVATIGSASSNEQSSPFASIGSFVGSTLPSALHSFVSGLAGKEVKTLPLILSVAVFFMTLVAIVGIIYASNHGGILALGRFGTINLSRYVVSHDVTQIATLVIGTFCLGIVVIFLTLAGL